MSARGPVRVVRRLIGPSATALLLGLAATGYEPDAAQAADPAAVVAYVPPPGSGVPRRVGGNARAGTASAPAVAVLAPDHLALTASGQPVLYWHISGTTTARIELVLVDPAQAQPVLEQVRTGAPAGIHAFDLAAAGARLRPGVAYEWSVAVVYDDGQRARDAVAGGALMRVEPDDALRARLARAAGDTVSDVQAAAGLWHDALQSLARSIEARPNDPAPRRARAALLEQAGLPAIAAAERQAANGVRP